MRLFQQTAAVHEDSLHARYAYPPALERPWVRLNFITSIDGAVSFDGRAGGLATPADQLVYGVLRDLADVILVGAGTVRAENYGGARPTPHRPNPPRIAVVTSSGALDPNSRLFTDTTVAPLILAGSGTHAARLRAAGAEVLVLGPEPLRGPEILAALDARGLRRVLCEGGPRLAGQLVSEGLTDELCLTTSPMLTSGTAGRIAVSLNAIQATMTLRQMIQASDGTLLAQWVHDPARYQHDTGVPRLAG